ncbi:toxin CcdB [Sphingopyxis panaciterrae]|uniref:CcdB family protein n=1 Tax=Sphingopyxis panaciterrae TaxID=363841 RepID=UPI001422FEFE|nr:CcdB family protein [Sphingopyxis panaciterrae]NIJ39106.1 toxin CcdB [Sphingopyxis panaciterrae]
MAQFDVHESRLGELLLDCQSDLLSHFSTRFVIPLMSEQTARTLPRLHPVFSIDGTQHILATQLASAVDIEDLGPKIASLADQRSDILNALDVLLTGV